MKHQDYFYLFDNLLLFVPVYKILQFIALQMVPFSGSESLGPPLKTQF